MTTVIPSDTNWNSLSGGSSSLGNPADLGPWRGMQQQRGATYDNRATDTYNWGLDRSDEIGDTSKKVVNQALDTSKAFSGYSSADRAMWDQNYAPAMLDQLNYAKDYTTDARKQANRGGAMADVSMTFDAAADLAKRNLMSYGVNPNSGQFAGLQVGAGTQRAKALAGAATKSDRDTEMMGQQLLDNAIGRGSILPGQAVNEAGVGIAAGNQAINTDLSTATTQQQLRQPSGWVQSGDQALQAWKDSLLQQTGLGLQQNRDVAQQQLAQQQLAQQSSSGVGAAVGGGLGMISSLFGKGGAFASGGALSGLLAAAPIAAVAKGGMIKRYADGGQVMADDTEDGALYGDEDEIAPADDEMAEQVDGDMHTPTSGVNPNMVPPDASPSGGAETDDVTARVNVGEFVMPKDVTSWYGEKFMQKLIDKARMEMQQKTAEPDVAPMPQAMAINPPSFASPGAQPAMAA